VQVRASDELWQTVGMRRWTDDLEHMVGVRGCTNESRHTGM